MSDQTPSSSLDQFGAMLCDLVSNAKEATASHSSRIKLPNPPMYDGSRDHVKIDDWFDSIDSHKTFYEWDNALTCSYALTFLTGRALQWLRGLRREEKVPSDWPTLKNMITEHFRPNNSLLLARDLLAACKQTSTIAAYVYEFEAILDRLPTLAEDEKCHRFMSNLVSEELRAILRNVPAESTNLQAHITTSLNWEDAHSPQHQSLANHLSAQSHLQAYASHPTTLTVNDPMEINLINQYRNKKNVDFKARDKAGTSTSDDGPMECYFCHKIGHSKKVCRSYKAFLQKRNAKAAAGGGTRRQDINYIEPSTSISSNNDSTLSGINYDASSNKASSSHQYDNVPLFNLDLARFTSLDLNSMYINTDLPLYHCTIPDNTGSNSVSAYVLCDSGASECYISPRLSSLIKGQHKQVHDTEIQTAGGAVEKITQSITFELNLQGFKSTVTAFIYDSKFDVILGRSWLKIHQPDMQWKEDTLVITDDTFRPPEKYIISPTFSGDLRYAQTHPQINKSVAAPSSAVDLNYLISYKQANRWMKKKDCQAGLLYIKDDGEISLGDLNTVSVGPLGGFTTTNTWVHDLVKEFPGVFQEKLHGIPPDRPNFQHVINTGDAKPVDRRAFKMSPLELAELRSHLKELLSLGLIQPSSSPWGAPVIFCKKKDGSLRMCIDYRALNQLTIRNTNPLPRIDECMDQLKGASHFTSLDLKSGYHQIRIHPDDVPKTGFNTRYGKFEFLTLPFGLCNAPPSFQAWMNDLLGDLIDKFILVYLRRCTHLQ